MEVRSGYKQTEVGVIPENWEFKKLGKVANVTMGQSPLSEFYNTNGVGLPLIQGNADIENRETILRTYTSVVTKKGKIGDIIMSVRAPVGEVSKATFDCCLGRGVCAISYKNEYIYQYLIHFEKSWSKLSTGSTFDSINSLQVKELEILVPILELEQITIANTLSVADSLITSLEKLIAKKRDIKQGTMQELLKPRKGWAIKKLGEVAEIIRGASPRPIEDPKWFDGQSSIGWVRISDVTKSKKYLYSTFQKLSEQGIKNSRYVSSESLIMSICATVGRPILTKINVCIHDGFVVFRNPQLVQEYLYYFLFFIEKEWAKNGQTGSQMNLNTSLIKATDIPFPKDETGQRYIATILSDMDAEISALESKLEKYKGIKLGMMQNLLTGKIRLI